MFPRNCPPHSRTVPSPSPPAAVPAGRRKISLLLSSFHSHFFDALCSAIRIESPYYRGRVQEPSAEPGRIQSGAPTYDSVGSFFVPCGCHGMRILPSPSIGNWIQVHKRFLCRIQNCPHDNTYGIEGETLLIDSLQTLTSGTSFSVRCKCPYSEASFQEK